MADRDGAAPDPLGRDRRIDSLCDAFEDAWRRGERPTPEAFLDQAGPAADAAGPTLPLELARLRSELEAGIETPSARTTQARSHHPEPSPPGSPLALPSAFGRFEVTRLLGAGGMGAVYEAFDPRLGREVALKLMLPRAADRPAAREQFLAEARAQAAVGHDHVVAIHEADEAGGIPYLVMPLLRGETLAARLGREGVLPPAEALRVAEEAARGLAALHARGLVHRDVKPGNLWLEASTGRVKVLDFGLACGESGSPGWAGTPAYLSPEQARGAVVDARSDLFSLGAVFYQALTGRRAFPGDARQALAAVAGTDPPRARDLNPDVPAGASELAARLLAKEPSDRPPTAAAVAADLHAIRAGLGVTGRPRRRGLALAAASVALVLLAVALAFRTREPAGPLPPLAVKADLRIWKKDDPRHGLDPADPRALPLRAGDYVRFEAEASRPAYLYVAYLDAKGDPSPYHPWKNYSWDAPGAERKVSRLALPEDPSKDAAPLKPGPNGVEGIVVIARDEPLSAAQTARLRAALTRDPAPAAVAPLRAAAWFDSSGMERYLVASDATRGAPRSESGVRVEDPVMHVRRIVRHELGEFAPAAVGVCFPFQGE